MAPNLVTALRSVSVLPRQRTRFEADLEAHERDRHLSLCAGRLVRPRGHWLDGDDGYIPAAEAAAVMGVTLDELETMIGRQMLDTRERWGQLHVRPAVVSVLGVGP